MDRRIEKSLLKLAMFMTGRKTYLSWHKGNTLHQKKSKMFIRNVDLFPSVSYTVITKRLKHICFFFTCALSQPSLKCLLMLGDSFNSSLVAIVAVDPDVLKDWAASEDIKVLLLFITLKTF